MYMGKVHVHEIELATAAPALEAQELFMLQSLGHNGAMNAALPGAMAVGIISGVRPT